MRMKELNKIDTLNIARFPTLPDYYQDPLKFFKNEIFDRIQFTHTVSHRQELLVNYRYSISVMVFYPYN